MSDMGIGDWGSSEVTRLAVVVIARNEERHIGECITALMAALHAFPYTRVILVDSYSTDRTVEIARTFPIEIYRYQGPPFSAAAGRKVGFAYAQARHVLFVDGDCYLNRAGWRKACLLWNHRPAPQWPTG